MAYLTIVLCVAAFCFWAYHDFKVLNGDEGSKDNPYIIGGLAEYPDCRMEIDNQRKAIDSVWMHPTGLADLSKYKKKWEEITEKSNAVLIPNPKYVTMPSLELEEIEPDGIRMAKEFCRTKSQKSYLAMAKALGVKP
jgi:hypothetical protein